MEGKYLADWDGAHHDRCSILAGGLRGPQVDNEEGEGQQAKQVDDQIDQVNSASVRQPARDGSQHGHKIKHREGLGVTAQPVANFHHACMYKSIKGMKCFPFIE